LSRLDLQRLTRHHALAQAPAVDDFSLTVRAGELVTLLGPSGCGKSTVLRMVAGLEVPDSGRVLIDGVDVTRQIPSDRPVSMVFQSYALFPHLSVIDNVAFGLRAAGVSDTSARLRACEALGLVALNDLAHRVPAELSGGQQQRVALARSLVLKPSLLLFDEPLSNLDERLRRDVREQIRALQQQLGLTVLYVTHDQAEAMAVSDRVVVMNQGRVVQVGTPRQAYEQPASAFVAEFMGEGLVLEATVACDGIARVGALEVPTTAPLAPGPVRVMVRPHAWRIQPPSTRGLAARVLRGAYLGRSVEYAVACALGEVRVVSPMTRSRHEPGAPVSLVIERDGAVMLAR
jgi:iron(III) transport system ATP-binding protein